MKRRVVWFSLLGLSLLGVYLFPLYELARLAIRYDDHSYTVVIPALSGFLIWLHRKEIFSRVQYCPQMAILGVACGATIYYFAVSYSAVLSANDLLSLQITSFAVLLVGLFALCFGLDAFRGAAFPALLLILMVPLPDFVLWNVVHLLQELSAEAVYQLFTLANVPVYRQGTVFDLPGFTIEIAKECSGIRSSVALLITALLAGHFYLRSWWGKLFLALAVFPLAVVKNGIRIFTLSWLSIYVDPGFLRGDLHRSGGILFFVLACGLLWAFLRLLQFSENQRDQPATLGLGARR